MNSLEKCRDILIKYENIIFAYIFGSFARDKIRTDSDIDIAIYLENKLDSDLYLKIKMDLTEELKREVDLIILNNATPFLKYEIYKNNILIFTRDKNIETRYKVKTLFEYNDMKKYLDLSYNSMIKRLKEEVKSDG